MPNVPCAAGAMGYLNKQESNEKLLEAIRAVLDGGRYMSPEITRRLAAQALGTRGADRRSHLPSSPTVNWKSFA